MDTKDITKGSFYGYIKNQRKAFVLEVSKYPVEQNLKLRTESDSLLIAYDQMSDRIKELEDAIKKHIETFDVERYSKDYLLLETALNNKEK